ncbi:hypothetical protein BGW41_000739 [Actinomortierella wolfii]|nr:hypothetical protein BGW41_000739 [Actinomortierella wolfii]
MDPLSTPQGNSSSSTGSPKVDLKSMSEEQRRIYLEEKWRRRNLAPEALLIRPGLRKLHIASLVAAVGKELPLEDSKSGKGMAGYFALYADFGDKETCFSPLRRYYRRKVDEFWSLSEEEKRQLQEQGRTLWDTMALVVDVFVDNLLIGCLSNQSNRLSKTVLAHAIYCWHSRFDVSENVPQRSVTPNHEARVFFFDIDNCLYPKSTGIAALMRKRIEDYFANVGFPVDEYQDLSYRYYLDYGLAIRGLVKNHPDDKVDGSLPLETILQDDPELRNMIKTLNVEKKWLFTNAGKNHALRVIKYLGLEGLFDGLTYCDYLEDDFACKPERKAFEKAMREAGVVHGSNCFFVDDSAANVDMAMDLGWTAVHVADDCSTSNFGHFQISNVKELPKVLPWLWDPSRAPTPIPRRNPVSLSTNSGQPTTPTTAAESLESSPASSTMTLNGNTEMCENNKHDEEQQQQQQQNDSGISV